MFVLAPVPGSVPSLAVLRYVQTLDPGSVPNLDPSFVVLSLDPSLTPSAVSISVPSIFSSYVLGSVPSVDPSFL